jgi:hypothetical protein
MLPLAGLLVGGLAIAFDQATSKTFEEVLFSGQDQLPGLVSGSSSWSVGALLLLLLCKGLSYSLSLRSFRGGPVFPAVFLLDAGAQPALEAVGERQRRGARGPRQHAAQRPGPSGSHRAFSSDAVRSRRSCTLARRGASPRTGDAAQRGNFGREVGRFPG